MDSEEKMSGLIELIRIDERLAQCDIWFKQAEEDGEELPIFRIAWGAAGWGPWIGWN